VLLFGEVIMGTAEYVAIGLFILGGLFSITSWMLKSMVQKQKEEMKEHKDMFKDLYDKHVDDSAKLAALELQLARNHYEKGEVTAMFNTFKGYLDEKFAEIKVSIGEINDRRKLPRD
jgi:hypothetical protein